MRQSLNIEPTDELRIAMYAHAANGGIRIDRNAWTGVKGLYACGELTSGMHGADRIGGLSSANGLVFGRIAARRPPVTPSRCHAPISPWTMAVRGAEHHCVEMMPKRLMPAWAM